jgi:hypothetical protein
VGCGEGANVAVRNELEVILNEISLEMIEGLDDPWYFQLENKLCSSGWALSSTR